MSEILSEVLDQSVKDQVLDIFQRVGGPVKWVVLNELWSEHATAITAWLIGLLKTPEESVDVQRIGPLIFYCMLKDVNSLQYVEQALDLAMDFGYEEELWTWVHEVEMDVDMDSQPTDQREAAYFLAVETRLYRDCGPSVQERQQRVSEAIVDTRRADGGPMWPDPMYLLEDYLHRRAALVLEQNRINQALRQADDMVLVMSENRRRLLEIQTELDNIPLP